MLILLNNIKCFCKVNKRFSRLVPSVNSYSFASKNSQKVNWKDRNKPKASDLVEPPQKSGEEKSEEEFDLQDPETYKKYFGDRFPDEDKLPEKFKKMIEREKKLEEERLLKAKQPKPLTTIDLNKQLIEKGSIKTDFLDKSNPDMLDHKSVSLTKLMDYHSVERKQKILYWEEQIILNKKLKFTFTKQDLKKKLNNATKLELVRELPRNMY